MNILVPTDFSDYARYAFDLALQIAGQNKATVHLYHSADIPDDWEHLDATTKSNDTANKYIAIEARNKMAELKAFAEEKGIDCKYHYTGGRFLKNITEVLAKIPVDLIVMGSHGASGKEEWFIGTNSQRVIRKISIDTLIVKEPIDTFDPKKVVFITGLDVVDKEAFKHFLDFISGYAVSEVHVLTIDTSSWFSQPSIVMLEGLKDFKEIASGYNCTTHFYRDYSIQAGIRHFVHDRNIDFIGISYKHRNPIKRLFQGNNVEMLVNHTELPILCVNK